MYAEVREMETYKIVRHYFNNSRSRVITRGLTLEEAQAHCSNPETSGSTSSRRAYTRRVGPWFDGYERE
jgi:hypothetical protein